MLFCVYDLIILLKIKGVLFCFFTFSSFSKCVMLLSLQQIFICVCNRGIPGTVLARLYILKALCELSAGKNAYTLPVKCF